MYMSYSDFTRGLKHSLAESFLLELAEIRLTQLLLLHLQLNMS